MIGKVNEFSRDDEFDGESEDQFFQRIRREALQFVLQGFEYQEHATFKPADEIDGISETLRELFFKLIKKG